MKNYFKLNGLHSFSDLKITGDSPIPPVFLTNNEEYPITFNYYYVKRTKSDISPYNHYSFLQSKLKEELDKDETRLILSQDLNYYYLIKSIKIEIIEINDKSVRYSIIFNVFRYKRLLNQANFEKIEITQYGEKEFIIDNKGLYAYPIFKITTNEINDTISFTINDEKLIILENVPSNSIVYLDFDLKEYYIDNKLLNNDMIGDFDYFKSGENLIRINTSGDSFNIKQLEVKVNSMIL